MDETPQKRKPTDPYVCDSVERFGQLVHRLKFVHHCFKELFGTRESTRLLEVSALLFFSELDKILIDYFFLEVAKLTDPPTSGRNQDDNISTQYFSEFVDWPPDVRALIEKISPGIREFRAKIVPARNKLIAHYDAKTVLADATLGGFSLGEDDVFLNSLEELANSFRMASSGKIWGDMVETAPGDAIDLKSTLVQGVAFGRLVREASSREREKLYDLLENVEAELKDGDEIGSEANR